jgi:cytochrome P450
MAKQQPHPTAPSGTRVPGSGAGALLDTARWLLRPIALMEDLARRHGDVFSFRLVGMGHVVMVSDPTLVKQIFTGDPGVLHAGEVARLLEPVVGRHSVLVLDGDEHMSERRLLLPPFHGERVTEYASLIERIAREEIARWPIGEPFELHGRMQAITLEVIIRLVFGAERESTRRELRRALGTLMDATGSNVAFQVPALRHDLGPWRPWSRMRALVADVDTLIFRQIAERRGEGPGARSDVLSMLLEARREDGSELSDEEVRDELVTVLAAGHETTATALSWGFELLFRNRDRLTRLQTEAREGGCEYADAVVKETLRLRPVIPLVARRLKSPWRLGPWSVPAGAVVAPSVYLMHRRADVYPDPYAFRPERFLDGSPGTYTWLPFGGGRRRCVGAAFAQLEMRVVLQEALRSLVLTPSGSRQHFRRRSITIAPGEGTPAIAHPAAMAASG